MLNVLFIKDLEVLTFSFRSVGSDTFYMYLTKYCSTANPTRIWLIIIICIIGTSTGQTSQPNTVYYKQKIQHSIGTYFQEELVEIPPSNKLVVKYYITFTADKCCPIAGLRQLHGKWPAQKAYYKACSSESLQYVALYSPTYIYLRENFPNSGCLVEGNIHRCNGSRVLASPRPIKWAVAAGYECSDVQPLNLTVQMELEYFTDFEFHCEPLHNKQCKEEFGYNQTILPNAIGQSTQKEANNLLTAIWNAIPLIEGCYKNIKQLACYGLFPDCSNSGKRILPCYQMCTEAAEACRAFSKMSNQPLECGNLLETLDPELCYYEPVRCPQPDPPDHGKVVADGLVATNLSHYSCDEGYVLRGPAVRNCTYSGKWNASKPDCEALFPSPSPVLATQRSPEQQESSPLYAIIPAVIAAIILIVITAFAVYHRQTIHLLCSHSLFMDSKNTSTVPEKGKLFITYSSEDSDEVNNSFLPEINQQLPSWKPITYQNDFVPGRPLLECINEGVWDSKAMLVLLTENYVTSNMCKFEFAEAETRSVTDRAFKLIVILFLNKDKRSPEELITELPENLRDFIKTRVYLMRGEPFFWSKLRRALSR